jgi:hypothetical protein
MKFDGEKYAAISPPYFCTMWASLPYIAEQYNLGRDIRSYVGSKGWIPDENEMDWGAGDRHSMEFIKN